MLIVSLRPIINSSTKLIGRLREADVSMVTGHTTIKRKGRQSPTSQVMRVLKKINFKENQQSFIFRSTANFSVKLVFIENCTFQLLKKSQKLQKKIQYHLLLLRAT